jgi:hypothetical protein
MTTAERILLSGDEFPLGARYPGAQSARIREDFASLGGKAQLVLNETVALDVANRMCGALAQIAAPGSGFLATCGTIDRSQPDLDRAFRRCRS